MEKAKKNIEQIKKALLDNPRIDKLTIKARELHELIQEKKKYLTDVQNEIANLEQPLREELERFNNIVNTIQTVYHLQQRCNLVFAKQDNKSLFSYDVDLPRIFCGEHFTIYFRNESNAGSYRWEKRFEYSFRNDKVFVMMDAYQIALNESLPWEHKEKVLNKMFNDFIYDNE